MIINMLSPRMWGCMDLTVSGLHGLNCGMHVQLRPHTGRQEFVVCDLKLESLASAAYRKIRGEISGQRTSSLL